MRSKLSVIININVLIYLVFVALIIGGLIQKLLLMQPIEELIVYTATMVLVVLITLFISFGLISRRNWARIWAICWNFFAAFTLIVLNIILHFVLKYRYNYNDSYFETLTTDNVFWLFLGIIFIFLSFFLLTKKVKRLFS